MSELVLESMKRRCEQATPGPWEMGAHSSGWYEVWTAATMPLPDTLGLLDMPGIVGNLQRQADAEFVVTARRGFPRVMSELELAKIRLDAIWRWATEPSSDGERAPSAVVESDVEEYKSMVRSLFDPNNAQAFLAR
jgi:hypothetical protein